MGTHPIFESDFDCLTECSLILSPVPHRVAFPSVSAICSKAVSLNLHQSTSMPLRQAWKPVIPAQPWKTSWPPAMKPIESQKCKISHPGTTARWLNWLMLLRLLKLIHDIVPCGSPSSVVVTRSHGLLKMLLKLATMPATFSESK